MERRRSSFRKNWLDLFIAGLVLAVLLLYTYGFFIRMPYIGLEINNSDPTIVRIYPNDENPGILFPGDRIITFGGIDLLQRYQESNKPYYMEFPDGSQVEVVLVRDGIQRVETWVVPGPTPVEFVRRLFSYWYLAYIFWAFGLATAILVRPRDDRWRLLVAFDYLMALWIIIGACSESRLWWSGTLMRSMTWIILPVSLALHWTFPLRLAPPKPWIKGIAFGVGFLLASLELLLRLPVRAFYAAILISLLGSIVLLIYQWIKSPDRRSEFRLPIFILGIFIVLAVESNFTNILDLASVPAEIILLFAPLLPMGYFYIIYNNKLADMEIRLNRWIGLAAFFALFFLPALPFLAALNLWLHDTGLSELSTLLFGLGAGLLAISLYPVFNRWFSKNFLGITDVSENLVTNLTAHLSASLEEENLVQVLTTKVFPSFFIRQALIIRLPSPIPGPNRLEYRLIVQFGVSHPVVISRESLKTALDLAGKKPLKTNPPPVKMPGLDWVRLVIPLLLEGQVYGLCLLGRRDPDDDYGTSDISLLQGVMNQVTIVLAHMEQTRNLRAFLQADITRQEDEKLRSALRLHDEVLGQLTVLGQSIDRSLAGVRFEETYLATVKQVREVIAGLRPSALNFGLEMAINDLVDRLTESNRTTTEILLEIVKNSEIPPPRYPADVELQLYRIVQQACQNALQHAAAAHIWVSGSLEPGSIQLSIIDDGKGFEINPVIDFEDFLKRKQYGLVGMAERAALIGARLAIVSAPGDGAEVRVHWRSVPQD